MPGKVFLNYRRRDSAAWADRIHERLKAQLPQADIFLDIDGKIPLGVPWEEWVDAEVATCDLMLALIGDRWIEEFQKRSNSEERDFVRVEIASALARNIPVVPVLLDDTPMPSEASLPGSIRRLLKLQATRLQRPSFDADVRALISGVAQSIRLTSEATGRPPSPSGQPRADGRIKVDAEIIHGASDGWFNPGQGKTEWFKDIDIGPEMVVVPAGKFVMGSNVHDNTKPSHPVTIKKPFAVGRFAMSFAEWDAADLSRSPSDEDWGRGRRPVINVSWEDAKAYITWLSRRTGKPYRLPSEAEWEYCCRAGTTTTYASGDNITRQRAQFNARETVEVGTFPPNDWGLYEMHGNVFEYCEDNWHANYNGAPPDGTVWRGGDASFHPMRGGSWQSKPEALSAAFRIGYRSVMPNNINGFRVARTLD